MTPTSPTDDSPAPLPRSAASRSAASQPTAQAMPIAALLNDDETVRAEDAGGFVFHRDWQALPARAWWVFQAVGLMVAAPTASLLWWVGMRRLPIPWNAWSWAVALAVLAYAVWLSHQRHRRTFWRLDADGFAVRRGRLWQWETRVPLSRVQHIDLKRGPLERHQKLASLVVHTAGTRLAGLDLSGIDRDEAERARDALAREVERRHRDDDD